MGFMEKEILRQIGLSDSQAKAYLAIINHETISPPQLAELIGENRTTTYSIIEKLKRLGLVKELDGKKMQIQAEDPAKIRQLLTARQKSLKTAASALTTILPDLTAKYRLATDVQTSLLSLSGLDDLEQVWNDIMRDGQPVQIISCIAAENDPDFMHTIISEVKRWNKATIDVQILAVDSWQVLTSSLLHQKRLTHRLSNDSLIICYDVTTVVIKFSKHGPVGVSVIIDTPITEMMQRVFDLLH
jgi:sugar-specific transcriptional regulator TrmB